MPTILKITTVALVLSALSGCVSYSGTGYLYPYAYTGTAYYSAYYPGGYEVDYPHYYGGWHGREWRRGDDRGAPFYRGFGDGHSGGALQARNAGHSFGGGGHAGAYGGGHGSGHSGGHDGGHHG